MAKQLIPGSDAIVCNPDGTVTTKAIPSSESPNLVGTFTGLTKITVSSTAPTNPNVGDLWFDTS